MIAGDAVGTAAHQQGIDLLIADPPYGRVADLICRVCWLRPDARPKEVHLQIFRGDAYTTAFALSFVDQRRPRLIVGIEQEASSSRPLVGPAHPL